MGIAIAALIAAALSGPAVQAQQLSGPRAVPAVAAAHAGSATMLGVARAGKRIVAVGDHGVVLLSDDGGHAWRQAKAVPVDSTLNAVSFVDAQQGWAVGHAGVVLATRDGGDSWILQRRAAHEDRPLFALHMFDAQHGVAVGLWSLVLVTADGGASWNAVTLPKPDGARKADLNLFGLFTDGKGRLFAAAERGMLLRSDDRGRHWSYLASGYKGSFWTGLATNDGALLAAGLRGSLYRSSDDGQSWTRVETRSKSSITALAQVAGEIVGVGLDGLVLRSRDGGASFKSERRADGVSLTAVIGNADGRPVWLSRQGVVTHAVALDGAQK
jgi:photosystem II stability/assembly factor-like uncharacterized protein